MPNLNNIQISELPSELLSEIIALTPQATRCIPTDQMRVEHAYVLAQLIAWTIDPKNTDIDFYFAELSMNAKLNELGIFKDIVVNLTDYSILVVNNQAQNTTAFSIVPIEQGYSVVNKKIEQSKRLLYSQGYPILI